jgi:hypothetical protein
MGEKMNTPFSYELEDIGKYESCNRMVKHEPLAFYRHGEWVEYEEMVNELHGAALWITTLESSHAELLGALKSLIEERTDDVPLLTTARIAWCQDLIKRATEEKQ